MHKTLSKLGGLHPPLLITNNYSSWTRPIHVINGNLQEINYYDLKPNLLQGKTCHRMQIPCQLCHIFCLTEGWSEAIHNGAHLGLLPIKGRLKGTPWVTNVTSSLLHLRIIIAINSRGKPLMDIFYDDFKTTMKIT